MDLLDPARCQRQAPSAYRAAEGNVGQAGATPRADSHVCVTLGVRRAGSARNRDGPAGRGPAPGRRGGRPRHLTTVPRNVAAPAGTITDRPGGPSPAGTSSPAKTA